MKNLDITVKYIDILIFFWYSAVLYTSQVLEVIKNAENDIFSLISLSLMFIFSQNIGHQDKISKF